MARLKSLDILQILSDGREYETDKIREKIIEKLGLSEQEINETIKDGRNKLDSNIASLRTKLKNDELIDYPKKRTAKITDKGLQYLENNTKKTKTPEDNVKSENQKETNEYQYPTLSKFTKIEYVNLTAKQQEIFNFQKIAGILADYGFNCIKLADDWQGADFIAYHKDEERTLRVQLKGRISIYKKYSSKNLYIAFPINKEWYLIGHEDLIEKVRENTNWLNTPSWKEKGGYSSCNPNQKLLNSLIDFKL